MLGERSSAMEDVELASPFKSPSISDLPTRRIRVSSGSSVSSAEKEVLSPHNRLNFYGATATRSHSRAGSEGRDENDPPNGCTNGGEHSRVNPFEKDILAGLQGSFWSPSILEIKETPPQRTWAIEHLSQLFPKDIENSPSTHQNSFPVDDHMEAQAQADIDEYFSRGPIVPTPSPMKQKIINVHSDVLRLKTTSTDVHCGHSPIARGLGVGIGLNGGNIKKLIKSVSVTERWTQTAISLPVNLPTHVEQLLLQYSQDVDACGSAGEAVTHCSQKSDVSDCTCTENGDTKDSGKNSSSLNNSIRRRLELSFGEDPDGEDSSQGLSQGMPTSPIADPFRRNHVVSTPPNSSSHFQLNTTTSELEVQLMRCEFTPEARGPTTLSVTPGVTPIHDEQTDELRSILHHACSTPRRNNNMPPKRWMSKEDQSILLTSPMGQAPSSSSSSASSNEPVHVGNCIGANGMAQCNSLRRPRSDNDDRVPCIKKRHSASSFDDSQFLMDDSSPPAKLYRRNLRNDDTMSDS